MFRDVMMTGCLCTEFGQSPFLSVHVGECMLRYAMFCSAVQSNMRWHVARADPFARLLDLSLSLSLATNVCCRLERGLADLDLRLSCHVLSG